MFFEVFREAAARLPAGLVRPGPAGDEDAIAAAQRVLGQVLPADYASFLRSFDGADLFHESIIVAGVGPGALLSLIDLNQRGEARGDEGGRDLAFAETLAGDRFVFSSRAGAGSDGAPADGEPAVVRVRAGSEERVLAGAGFCPWLEATLAREQILYGPDGEFAPEVFDPDGEEIVPRVALRQAERALRRDPGSAESHHDRGIALRRLGRASDAAQAFEQAGQLDQGNPWLWFDLGRTVLEHDPARALSAFRRAAEVEVGPSGARMLAWAAHAARAAGDDGAAAVTRAAALARQPDLVADLGRALAAAVEEGDSDAAIQAEWLVSAIDPAPVRVRLPILGARAPAPAPVRGPATRVPQADRKSEPRSDRRPTGKDAPVASSSPPAARRPPPGRPRRPGRGAPPPPGGSRPGSKR